MAIIKKRLKTDVSFYTMLQILNLNHIRINLIKST